MSASKSKNSTPKNSNNKRKATSNKKTRNPIKISLILGAIGILFTMGGFTSIGKGSAASVAGVGVFVGLVAAFFSVTGFLDVRKDKSDTSRFFQAIVALVLSGVVAFGSLISIIADPIATNVRCSSFNSKDEMSLDDMSVCRQYAKELEQREKEEKQSAADAAKKLLEELHEACEAKDYSWNEDEGRCNTDEEQAESIAKKECSAKDYNWNYDEKRCNTDAEQQAANQKKAEEEAKRAEANKTTTYTGQDHDSNDSAGRYTKLMNACLDRLDYHYPKTYPLDSGDGYPIHYSVTLKGDGTLASGSMTGYHKTYNGNKILSYGCKYENGSAKITGLDD